MSSEKKKNGFNPEDLSIVDFKISKGLINVSFDFDHKLIEDFETDMIFDVSFDQENHFLKADMGFTIKTISNNKNVEEAYAEFNFVYIYALENFGNMVEVKNGEIGDVNNALLVSVAAISFSTSRGILMTRLQGTAMKEYMLPIIDPEELLESD